MNPGLARKPIFVHKIRSTAMMESGYPGARKGVDKSFLYPLDQRRARYLLLNQCFERYCFVSDRGHHAHPSSRDARFRQHLSSY